MSRYLTLGVGAGRSLGKYRARTSWAKQTASVETSAGRPVWLECREPLGEVDMDERDGQGSPTAHRLARWESGVDILMSMIGKNVLKDSGQGSDMC